MEHLSYLQCANNLGGFETLSKVFPNQGMTNTKDEALKEIEFEYFSNYNKAKSR